MRKFLLTWYGITDFRASLGLDNTEGPIAAALAAENYTDVVILCYTRPNNDPDECRELQESFAPELSAIRDSAQPSDWDTTRKFVSKYVNSTIAHEHFASWLRAKFQKPDGSLNISFKSETLRELNDTEGIYACAMRSLDLVAQEPGDRLVDFGRVLRMPLIEVAVLVPLHFAVAVRDLKEPHAPLQKAAGQQTLSSEILRHRIIDAVQFLRRVALAGQVLHLRHCRLHPKGQLERIETAFQSLIAPRHFQVIAVHRGDQIQLLPLQLRIDAGVADVFHPHRRG